MRAPTAVHNRLYYGCCCWLFYFISIQPKRNVVGGSTAKGREVDNENVLFSCSDLFVSRIEYQMHHADACCLVLLIYNWIYAVRCTCAARTMIAASIKPAQFVEICLRLWFLFLFLFFWYLLFTWFEISIGYMSSVIFPPDSKQSPIIAKVGLGVLFTIVNHRYVSWECWEMG